jgi:hypothetical protein
LVLPGSLRRVSAQADPRRSKLPFGIGPENGGARENDQRRERSGSTERGSTSHEARGVGIGAREQDRKVVRSDMRHRQLATRVAARHDASGRIRPKRRRLIAHHLQSVLQRELRGPHQSLSSNHGIASPCVSARDEGARKKLQTGSRANEAGAGGPFRRQYRSDEHCTTTTSKRHFDEGDQGDLIALDSFII